MEGAHYEIWYYDKTGSRVFEEFRTRRVAERRLEKLVKDGTVDAGRDYTVTEFDAEGDIK